MLLGPAADLIKMQIKINEYIQLWLLEAYESATTSPRASSQQAAEHETFSMILIDSSIYLLLALAGKLLSRQRKRSGVSSRPFPSFLPGRQLKPGNKVGADKQPSYKHCCCPSRHPGIVVKLLVILREPPWGLPPSTGVLLFFFHVICSF